MRFYGIMDAGQEMYKSDHYGIEIQFMLICLEYHPEYKSDHYGIEI